MRDFDTEQPDLFPPITECPDCGYDGEGLEEQLAEINLKLEQFNLGKIDAVDCLRAISEIFREAEVEVLRGNNKNRITELEGDLRDWRETFRTTQTEFAAERCEIIHKELEDLKKAK